MRLALKGRALTSSPLGVLSLGALLAALSSSPALAAPPSGLMVVPRPAQPGLSYFKLTGRPGAVQQAGSIELRNRSAAPLRVVLVPVDGETLSTLGSTYAPPGSRPRGAARWLRLGARATTLPPHGGRSVPVSVAPPSGAQPGDYLGGISVEARDQRSSEAERHGVSIASVSRYVVGAEVSLPGPRHPLIQFTGARIRREPAGLTFTLLARNPGNVILQNVHGYVRISRAGHTVISQTIPPGTFLAHTSVDYPVNAYRQTPREGTHFAIVAWMRYAGGIARLSTTVTFGHRAAVAQQQYGGPPASAGGTAWWKIAAAVAVALYALATTGMLLRRRVSRAREPTQP